MTTGVISGLMQTDSNFASKATDPRDRVLALLNLSTDQTALGIRANYSESCAEVYTEVTRAMVRNNDLNVLSFANAGKSQHDLPSWVVDWSVPHRESMLLPNRIHQDDWNYNATKNSRPAFDEGTTGERILSLSGCAVEKIAATVETAFTEPESLAAWQFSTDPLSAINPQDEQRLYRPLAELFEILRRKNHLSLTTIESCVVTLSSGKTHGAGGSIGRANAQQQSIALTQFMLKAQGLSAVPDDVGSARYRQDMINTVPSRRLFVTESGRIGLGPDALRTSDEIVLIHGADIPYIIRPAEGHAVLPIDQRDNVLVGEAYVYGIMDGEFMATKPASVFIRLV